MLGEERRNPKVVGQARDGEIAPVDDPAAEGGAGRDDAGEIRMQLRRAAGDVERGDGTLDEHPEARVDDVRRHRLGTVRPRVDMTVPAGLIALLADVDLEHVDPGGDEREEPGPVERGLEGPRQR